MAAHNTLTGAELHEPKGAAAATLGFALIANGAGSSSFLPVIGANTVIVRQLSDLPTPSGGKHTLAANTSYRFGADVDIGTNFLEFGAGTDVVSAGAFTTILTYTGTGSMLVGVDVNATVQSITLNAPNAQVFDFSETTSNTKVVLISDVLILNCLTTGTVEKLRTLVVNGLSALNCTKGFVFKGANQTGIRLTSVALLSTSATYIGLDFTGSTQKTVNINGVIFEGGAGSIGIKGDTGSANIAANFLANVGQVQFEGVTTALSGISVDDIRWNFQGNGIVSDTMPDAMVSLTNNTTDTVIAAVDTPTLVLGTFVQERGSHFTTTTAGRLTYVGERDLTTPVDACLTLDPVSGTNKVVRAYIALNGTVITNSGKAIQIDSADPREITLMWQLTLTTNDFLEIFIENETDAVDFTVVDAILRAR